MGKKIIIQEEITVDQKFIDECIKHYKGIKMNLGFGDFIGGSKEIIREIKKLSPNGKRILLMRYNFTKWEKNVQRRNSN